MFLHRYPHLAIDPNDPPAVSQPKQHDHSYRTIGCLFNHQSFYANTQVMIAIFCIAYARKICGVSNFWLSSRIHSEEFMCGDGYWDTPWPLLCCIPPVILWVILSFTTTLIFALQQKNQMIYYIILINIHSVYQKKNKQKIAFFKAFYLFIYFSLYKLTLKGIIHQSTHGCLAWLQQNAFCW